MRLSLIAAMAENRAIGIDGRLPWNLPSEFKHFKETTMGKPMIMGRRTFETLKKPLPGRTHIIVTRNKDYPCPEGHYVAGDFDEACSIADKLVAKDKDAECMVVGGAEIYKLAMAKADRMYLSVVRDEPKADTYFPKFNKKDWYGHEERYHPKDKTNALAWGMQFFERIG